MKIWTSALIIIIVAVIGYLVLKKAPAPVAPLDATQVFQEENPDTQTAQTMDTQEKVQVTVIKEGEGKGIASGQTAVVNYTGKLDNGTAFDSNVDPKFNHVEPFEFQLGTHMVIQGWEDGIVGMKVGEKRTIVVPASLGYGAAGFPPVIPQNATLTFDVELVGIK